jgi:hypothetical protein
MKLNSLRQLIKEELTQALRDLKNMPLENMEEGTYKVDYITEDPIEGGPGMQGSVTKSFTKEDFKNSTRKLPSNFWMDVAIDAEENERIYKIDKVTRA